MENDVVQRGLAIFSGDSAHWATPFLKKGFEHVWCAVIERDYWVSYDWIRSQPRLRVEAHADFDLASFYMEQGCLVVDVGVGTRDAVPWIVNNCVGHTKLVLGINHWAWTPWQLYQHLTRDT